MTPVSGRPGHMDGTPMTTFTRKGWQSHGSHGLSKEKCVLSCVSMACR